MKIDILEHKIEGIQHTKLSSILELIIDAVRNYPIYGLDDTDVYFDEIKTVIGFDKINIATIVNYLRQDRKEDEVNQVWVESSLTSLLEAFHLMELYQISYDEVQDKIRTFA